MTIAVLIVLSVAAGAGFEHLRRSRAQVMDYHQIETPRVNEKTRGARGDDG